MVNEVIFACEWEFQNEEIWISLVNHIDCIALLAAGHVKGVLLAMQCPHSTPTRFKIQIVEFDHRSEMDAMHY